MSRATRSMKLKSTEPSVAAGVGTAMKNHIGFLDAFSGAAGEREPSGRHVFSSRVLRVPAHNRNAPDGAV